MDDVRVATLICSSESDLDESEGQSSSVDDGDVFLPILLGSRAGAAHGLDDCTANSDWDIVTTSAWALENFGPQIWPQSDLEKATKKGKGFFCAKVRWRDTLLDVTVPIKSTSFAAQLLAVEWKKTEKIVSIGATGCRAIVPNVTFLYYIKESHAKCQRSLDWEKHMRKLSRFPVEKPYDKRVYPVADALHKQHVKLYGQNGEPIDVANRWAAHDAHELATMAFELGLSLQEFSCRAGSLWSLIVRHFDQVLVEYEKLMAPKMPAPKLSFSQQIARLWQELPGDVHILIFKRLRAKDLRLMQCVCRAWKEYFADESVVRFIFQAQFAEPFAGTSCSKPVLAIEARECCGLLAAVSRSVSSKDTIMSKCLHMREDMYVNHRLPPPRELSTDELRWLEFVISNIVLVANPLRSEGSLKGRELHETPKHIELTVWFPGHICNVSFHAGTEGSSQTSWEAIRLVVHLSTSIAKTNLLRIDTNGVDLFHGAFTRYGEVYVSGHTDDIKGLDDRLNEKCGAFFDLGLLFAFLCTCLVDDVRTVQRVARYLTDLPGLNKASVAKREARDRKWREQQQRQQEASQAADAPSNSSKTENEDAGKKCIVQ